MKRTVVIGLASLAFAGCANLNSIHQTANLPDGRSHLIDAKQRAIVVWPLSEPEQRQAKAGSGSGKGATARKAEDYYSRMYVCTEPSPDAFSVLATSGEFSLTGETGAAAAGSLASTETGASLVRRTTTIQALRDAYFRLCEAHANGAIDDIDLMVGQRHNQTMLLGMLAVEQLTGAMAAPAVAIGGSAEATSASSMQAIGAAYSAELKKKTGHDAAVVDTTEAHAKAKAEREAHEKVTQPTEEPAKTQWADKLASYKAAENKAKDSLGAAQADAKVNADLIAAYSKMLQNAGETGSMAQSAIPVVFPSFATGAGTSTQADIARAVESIVKIINGNDFGPTICLSSMKSAARSVENGGLYITGNYVELPEMSPVGRCGKILDAYISGMEQEVAITRATARLMETIAGFDAAEMAANKDLAAAILGIAAQSSQAGSSGPKRGDTTSPKVQPQ